MDLRTHFSPLHGRGDLVEVPLGLDTDDGLETAVVLSLFTDRRAPDAVEITDGSGHRRGWWGDAHNDIAGDQIGSLLWLLAREKRVEPVRQRAREYAREALAWLIEDGVARGVEVEASWLGPDGLRLDVQIHRASATSVRYRFDHFWNSPNGI